MKNTDQNIRVNIADNNQSIQRDNNKCIKCGECARICSKIESINNNYDINTSKEPVCVNCGQCVKICPTNCINAKEDYKQVEQEINNGKIVIVSTAPAVRVALGDEFGYKRGTFLKGKMVALLKKLGFKYVLDTNFGADVTIMEEANELLNRLENNDNLPLFTSCCPSWVKFVETYYPELINNLSSCKSPISMQGALIKTYFAQKMSIDAKQIVNVTLTPCVAKKYEIKRTELNSSSKINNALMQDNDYCITTMELVKWAKEKHINLHNLDDQNFDSIMGESSGGGIIFGASGGVMESALRMAYYYETKELPQKQLLSFKSVRGIKGIKETEVTIGNKNLKVAVVNNLANARILLNKIKNGEHYDFVEVMACPGGCIGGGGQPKHLGDEISTLKSRADALYTKDKNTNIKLACQNEEIKELYNSFLISPNSELAKSLLHTKFIDKSASLGNNLARK